MMIDPPRARLSAGEKRGIGIFAWIVAASMGMCAVAEPTLSFAFWVSLGLCIVATFAAAWITIGRWQRLAEPEYAQDALTFEDFRRANLLREEYFDQSHDWLLGQWGNAMGGECGEAQNVIKKFERGDYVGRDADFRHDLGEELVGTITYIFKVAEKAGIDLPDVIPSHWNEVSDRITCPIKIPEAV